MIVVTACRVDERKFVGFFFWTLVEEGKEFAGHGIGYCFTGLVACLRLSVSCVLVCV